MTAELSIYEKFIDAGIPHYTGADSFALNGAFAGYGVDYANLGAKTADMVADILLNGADPATTPVAVSYTHLDVYKRQIMHRLQLVWGVTPLKGYEKDSTEPIISQAMSVVRRKRLAKKGDLIVFTVGDPATNMTREGAVTNMLHVIEAK